MMAEEAIRLRELIAPNYLSLHRDIRRHAHGEYWLMGGRGSGKSSFVALEIVLGMLRAGAEAQGRQDAWRRELMERYSEACPERALSIPPERGDVPRGGGRGLPSAIVYRRVAATLRESVYAQMLWAIDRLGARDCFECRLNPPELRCRATDQRILFRGADDPQKSKSMKLARGYFGYLWFEELAEFAGMEAVRTIQASILRGGDGAQTFYTYNPPRSARSWVNEEALRRVPGRLTHRSSYLELPRAWLGEDFFVHAEALRGSDERAYRHMYLGEITGALGQVFSNIELRAIPEAELDAIERRYCGLDFGFAIDPDAFVRWAFDRKSRALYAEGEFYASHNSAERLAAEVKRGSGGGLVRCDAADPRMIAEMTRRGVRAIAARKGAGSVERGMRWLQSLSRIVIDPARTPNIAREFAQYEYARDRYGNSLPEYPDRDNHAIDATRYALEPEIDSRVATTRNDLY